MQLALRQWAFGQWLYVGRVFRLGQLIMEVKHANAKFVLCEEV